MYRIAICDDELRELQKSEILLEAYKLTHPNCNFTVWQFTSVEALLTNITQTGSYDLLLLDIYFPEENGIEGAKTLRAQGLDCPIIFMTTSMEHAVDAFEVDAVQYLIKPVKQTRFFATMDAFFNRIAKEHRQYVALRWDGELRKIALHDIVCCESHGNYQYLTLTNNNRVRVRMTLAELHALLSDSLAFVRVGMAYLVNLSHVDSLSAKEILLDNHRKINVPRGNYPMLKEQYFEFYCNRKEGEK